ncbi:tryptophan synthase subunit alpha [Wenzhouxiangella sp. AB-CW3]|uniref:tryptophan synthase subunit alpha n=1 Tax=Wenzhouxiangella sp. AB-CW3 TaxID=2771012 RepID=UPI00168B2EA6|nr:tryptophan synthase subunit alpha [Wenzhouxiangella sp. AB-CW3]QOC23575.1 tryptophan synthase subunit alpha [Wenzhouxiangella sp. AB-CW3]
MNRIDARFRELKESGRTALIPYVTAGYPQPGATVPVLHAAVEAGADLLEVGMPFSDVMADGPVIQEACARALEQGTHLDEVLAMVAEFRRNDPHTPVILMGYTNPIERRGVARFVEQAADAGVDGLLIVDCPAEEAADMRSALAQRSLHQIFLVAPTTTESRLERTATLAGGFVYYVSIKGVTGAATLDTDSLAPAVARIRSRMDLPVAVGFGIRTPEQAAASARAADAVVIGSALVSRLGECIDVEQAVATAHEYLAPIRESMENNAPSRTNKTKRTA